MEISAQQLKLNALLAEFNRLSNEITERLKREATFIQIMITALVLVATYVITTYKENPYPVLGLIVPSIIGIFCWLSTAEHMKVRRTCAYLATLEERINKLLNYEAVGWEHYLSTLTPLRLSNLRFKIFTHDFFFLLILLGSILFTVHEYPQFTTLPGLSNSLVSSAIFVLITVFLILNIIGVIASYWRVKIFEIVKGKTECQ